MGSSFYLSMIMRLLSLLSCFHFIIMISSSSSKHPLCRDDERSALLQFNQSFSIDPYNRNVSGDPFAYPKTASWKTEESSDCCSWDGVECDNDTGHVIGLDLSSSFLYGSINSSSSLFRLLHLQKLNLADNDFNYSQIPSRIGHLSRLTYLDLSFSQFSGPIPSKISELSKLAFIDLSFNVEISSEVPGALANFSSLTSLHLHHCGLHGDFPTGIFQLPNLHTLDVGFNPDLTAGYLPKFNKSSPLTILDLSSVSFSGKLPDSIDNLHSLIRLDFSGCNFSGSVPSSLGNLTQLAILDLSFNNFDTFSGGILSWLCSNLEELYVLSDRYMTTYLPEFNKSSPLEVLALAGISFPRELPDSIGNLNSLNELEISGCNFYGSVPSSLGKLTQLTGLDLSRNNFSGSVPSSLGKLTQLTWLDLSRNNFTGDIPSSLGNLTQLQILYFNSNHLTGQIPSSLANLTQLIHLILDFNKLHGPIPQSIYGLQNLTRLHLNHNNLSGTVELDTILNLKNLVSLHLSYNKISLLTETSINATLQKFKFLGLATCNLNEFPDFLRHQDELEFLNLSGNRIQGKIPKWIWNIGKDTLTYFSVSHNSLTSFDQPPVVLPWTFLDTLDLRSNMLHGSLLIPPQATSFYLVSNNSLTGGIPPLICNLTSLYALDLSNNNLSGILPQCLGNFSDSLSVLNLRNNNFHGTIPQTYTKASKLRMIDLSHNQLHGQLPRTLANCKMLEILNLGNNHINDTFPSWLGTIPKLRVLILRSNEFHGAIRSSETKIEFPKLRIIDLSYNSFTGKLPSEYFENWNAMKIVNVNHFTYMETRKRFGLSYYSWNEKYKYSMIITNKGIQTIYERIPEVFTAIDLSSNRFEGDIPGSIGNLKALRLLNLSNNILTGHIPSCLENLTVLESLALSQNKLSGKIPQQLTRLTFLASFNVSHNHLVGPIPRGQQFDTFPNSSFEGNSELCGDPLTKKCEDSKASPLPPSTTTEQGKDKNSKFPSGYDWIFISAGYGSGLVVGLVIGHIVTTRKHGWFVETFGRRPQRSRRRETRDS